MNKKTSVVFFGSGPVAAKSLELLSRNFQVEAVITKPSTATMMSARSSSSHIYSVNNRQQLDALVDDMHFSSQLAVLIDFGIIVSQKVINYFSLGIINSHFSLLPKWRGADPITFAILSGQERTGVSLMLLVEKMDEGPLLAQESLAIDPDDTGVTLTNKLIELSDRLLADYLPKYASGAIASLPQSKNDVSYSRKLVKEDGLIDWSKSATQIEREIRAFIEWPKSHTSLGSIEVIITGAHSVPSQPANSKPGDIEVVNQAGVLMVATGSGSLCVERLKPAGRSEMTAAEFLRGYARKLNTDQT